MVQNIQHFTIVLTFIIISSFNKTGKNVNVVPIVKNVVIEIVIVKEKDVVTGEIAETEVTEKENVNVNEVVLQEKEKIGGTEIGIMNPFMNVFIGVVLAFGILNTCSETLSMFDYSYLYFSSQIRC